MSEEFGKKAELSAIDYEVNQLNELSRSATTARIFRDSAGSSLKTKTQLELRFDHAAAVDAVYDDANLDQLLSAKLIEEFAIFQIQSAVSDKVQFLANPDSGRELNDASVQSLKENGSANPDVQIFIGDGLSAAAVRAQIPLLLPPLDLEFRELGLTIGRCFFVKYCRVGLLNVIGDILRPKVAILLIGERPGLSTAESLSAYMAFDPDRSHSDADRNLLSNIHNRGIPPTVAARRIVNLANTMLTLKLSGVQVKEDPLGKNLPKT